MMDEFWSVCNILKMMDGGSSRQTTNCLFSTILEWLGQPSFEKSVFSAPSDLGLFSYLTFTLSKYLLRCSASIFINYSRFPYQEEVVNQWFTVSAEKVQRDNAVHIMNVDKEGQTNKCYTVQNTIDNFPASLEDDDFEMFFHGTSHENAEDIMENGIDLAMGKKGQEFSSGDGFYLGKSFDEACKWKNIRRHLTSAVLVFRVKRVELRGDNKKPGLDLRQPEKKKEWKMIVSQFTSGEPNINFRKHLNHNHKFIEGPMACASRKNPTQRDGTYQLCIRNNDCAELFDRSLHSIVFFGK